MIGFVLVGRGPSKNKAFGVRNEETEGAKEESITPLQEGRRSSHSSKMQKEERHLAVTEQETMRRVDLLRGGGVTRYPRDKEKRTREEQAYFSYR